MKIGFIGVGMMGKSIVRNLLKGGHEVQVYTRTKAKILDILDEGAVWKDTAKECAIGVEAIMTMVGFPSDVEDIYFSDNGIIQNANKGTFVIDLTTSQPNLAIRIFEEAKANGLKALDAPVTGGDTGAKNGTLTILVGGDKADFDEILPVLQMVGKDINYCGKAGNGQHTKMCNQIAVAANLSGICETLAYAKAHGLDWNQLYSTLSTGSASSKKLSDALPKILEGDFNARFYIKHFIKDLEIAKSESEGLGLDILSATLDHYKKLADNGMGDLGTQALIKYYVD